MGTSRFVGGSVSALAYTEAVRDTVAKIIGGIILCLFTAPLGASAQPTDKVFRIRLFGS